MEEKPFLKEEEFVINDSDNKPHKYILSNFDSVTGRRIIAQYPLTAVSKTEDSYNENEKLMILLMSYVAVKLPNGHKLRLSTAELIANHVPEPEMLMKIEMKMMEKNCSFFRDGRFRDFLDNLFQIFSRQILEMLTLSSQQSSETNKQPSMSSAQSTT